MTTRFEPMKVFVVWSNTDLCEGRGREYAKYYTELETTARRLAKGGYVQGTDCRVTEGLLHYIDGKWYAPGPRIEPGTREDVAEEERLIREKRAAELKERAVARARELGLTDEEIAALKG